MNPGDTLVILRGSDEFSFFDNPSDNNLTHIKHSDRLKLHKASHSLGTSTPCTFKETPNFPQSLIAKYSTVAT